MRRVPARLALASLVLGAAGYGCLTHTEFSLVLTTDVPCGQLKDVAISVGPSSSIESVAPTTTTTTCTQNGAIGTITVIPGGADDSEVAIKVVAGVGRQAESCTAPGYGAGCIVARRDLAFIPHTSLTIPILLSQSCNGVICAPDETCVQATCQSSTIPDPKMCTAGGCPESVLGPQGGGGCPSGHGPSMVRVASGSRSFCIDSTDVTRLAYAEFLNAKVPLSSLPAECKYVTDFTPQGNWPPDATTENLPVVNVDWCDAHTFCAWAGKSLCGAVEGGPVGQSHATDPHVDAWFAACTAGGTRTYPYGNRYEPMACNDLSLGVGAPTPVASLPKCEGGYPGLFDMSGNVLNWEDACDASGGGNPQNDICLKRGGYYAASMPACSSPDSATRSSNWDFAGFRCCAQ